MRTLLSFLFFCTTIVFGQPTPEKNTQSPTDAPRLVLGIVVDQMRYDYLTLFYHRYGEGGFKRLINEGFEFKNNHFNYIPTYTGPGHASVYTGTYPAIHGVIANDWYDKEIQKSVYCVEDRNVTPVGTEDKAGKMSPHRMKTTTITDQLNLHTQSRAKVIGIGLKTVVRFCQQVTQELPTGFTEKRKGVGYRAASIWRHCLNGLTTLMLRELWKAI